MLASAFVIKDFPKSSSPTSSIPSLLCLSQIKSGYIGGAARRELGGKECARSARRRARPAYPSPRIDAYGPRCSISCTTAVCDGDADRRTQQHGQGTPVGSNR